MLSPVPHLPFPPCARTLVSWHSLQPLVLQVPRFQRQCLSTQ